MWGEGEETRGGGRGGGGGEWKKQQRIVALILFGSLILCLPFLVQQVKARCHHVQSLCIDSEYALNPSDHSRRTVQPPRRFPHTQTKTTMLAFLARRAGHAALFRVSFLLLGCLIAGGAHFYPALLFDCCSLGRGQARRGRGRGRHAGPVVKVSALERKAKTWFFDRVIPDT